MLPVHKTIVDAVIRKADALCPDSLALIGLYGSAATGDLHGKSDLDLLILIKDDKGWQLGKGFILEDSGIGYDIYCTNWDMLEGEAACEHAHLTKLMDSVIVYVRDEEAMHKLEELRKQAASVLNSDARFEKAQALMENAKKAYADCFLGESLSQVRLSAGGVLFYLVDAVMLFNGTYFRKGVKRTYEELHALKLPFDLPALLENVVCAKSVEEIRAAVTQLMRITQSYMTRPAEKQAPNPGLAGTYEEMFSNWRNKMPEAAASGNAFASFMNTLSFQFMLCGIASQVQMEEIDLMGSFDAADLQANAQRFDEALQAYLAVYKAAGIEPVYYADAEEFVSDYLKNEK